MTTGTVKVRGLRELNRALGRMDKDLRKELNRELREAAKVVQDDARSRFTAYDARSAMGMRAVGRSGRALVQQRYGRTTGHHPEFGALQMRRAFLPALASKSGEIETMIEEMLENLGRKNGF